MKIVRSVNGVPIRLSAERLGHIERRHPEMKGEGDRILEVISDPDMIQTGDGGSLLAVRHYARTPLTEKLCVVVYKEIGSTDGFVLTAYFATNLNERRHVIWKR